MKINDIILIKYNVSAYYLNRRNRWRELWIIIIKFVNQDELERELKGTETERNGNRETWSEMIETEWETETERN